MAIRHLDLDQIVNDLRTTIAGFENCTREDIFVCSKLTPWTIAVKETHMITVHPNTNDENVCEDCMLNMDELE